MWSSRNLSLRSQRNPGLLKHPIDTLIIDGRPEGTRLPSFHDLSSLGQEAKSVREEKTKTEEGLVIALAVSNSR